MKDFKIIETLLFYKDYKYLNLHLNRMKKSAIYFNFKFSDKEILENLNSLKNKLDIKNRYKVRMLLSRKGETEISYELIEREIKEYLIMISNYRVRSSDIFLYHKTTNRELYNRELKKAKGLGFFDVIFLNERDELTEGAITNLYIKKHSIIYTPPIECGLLPGIIREVLIKNGRVHQKKLYLEDLKEADVIYISNSIIGFKKASLRI